jgi:hypothetical protein
MPIKFKCPSCDQMLGIARRKAGSVISCPRCSYPATVPAEEGEPARPAAVGRTSHRPAFERGDFDRWIGGRPPSSSSGGTILANPPAVALPTISESHTGLLDTHRDRVQRESSAPVIDVRLAVALILGLGLATFGGGFWLGRNSAVTRATQTISPSASNDTAKPGANAADPTAVTAASKFVLDGVVEYRSGGKSVPDAGARILAFPTTQKPLKKISVGGLKPGEEKGLDQAGFDALKKLGGAATTADANGKYSLPLPKEGAYWILVLSKNVARPGPLTLQVEEQKLHNYFEDVQSLLGGKEFTLVIRRAGLDDNGQPVTPPLKSMFTPPKT